MSLDKRRAVWQRPLSTTAIDERVVSSEKEAQAAITDWVRNAASFSGRRKLTFRGAIRITQTLDIPQVLSGIILDFNYCTLVCTDTSLTLLKLRDRATIERLYIPYSSNTSLGSIFTTEYGDGTFGKVIFNDCEVGELNSSSVANLFTGSGVAIIEPNVEINDSTFVVTTELLTQISSGGLTVEANNSLLQTVASGSIVNTANSCTFRLSDTTVRGSITTGGSLTADRGVFVGAVTCGQVALSLTTFNTSSALTCAGGSIIGGTHGSLVTSSSTLRAASNAFNAALTVSGGSYSTIIGNSLNNTAITTSASSGSNTIIGNTRVSAVTSHGTDQVANNT